MAAPLLYLDSSLLSNLNRRYQESITHIVEDFRDASGGLHRDFVATKRRFSIDWDMLPWSTSDVPDGGLGTDSIASLSPSATHTLQVYRDDTYSEYTVLLAADSPSLELVYRDSGGWWYRVGLELEEK
ncbi:MAG: hypothetical protein WC116_09550 [Thermovirgaceae bacterium]|jgi:hypothetical protein